MSREKFMTESKLRTIVNVGTIVATIFLVALIIGLIFQFVNRNVLQAKHDQLQAELNRLNYEVEYYENMNNYIGENIEDYAREYYGYGKNGEKKYSYDS